MIGKVEEMSGKTVKLQKSKNVKEMQTFVPVIQNLKNLNEFSQYSFPSFCKCKIDSNYQTYFGYIVKIQVKKTSLLKNEFEERELSGRKILEVPTVTSVIDTRFPADEKNKNSLYDMAVTDDNKVWMGGESRELKLFDLQGHLHHTVSITDHGMFLCMYNKQVVYSDVHNKAVKMIYDTGAVFTMSTGNWMPCGVTSVASGDLLVCVLKDDQSKVVRYSSTGIVLQDIPLYKEATYITENINGDIIVTDWEQKAVIAVDRLGIFRYSYSGEDSNCFVCSVATDSVGHVIVTDFNGNKMHMLNRDGRFLRYIIPEGGINRPRGGCILGHGEMMVGETHTGIAKRIKYLEE